MKLPAFARRYYEQWLARRLPQVSRVELDQRRIFIFPTGYGFFYLFVASLLFIGGINYENNLILSLSFFMASLFVIAILHTFRNLSGLGIRNGSSESGFAGEEGALEVALFANHRQHECIFLQWEGNARQQVSLAKGEEKSVWLNLVLPARGKVYAPRLKIESYFPLGLLRTWSYLRLSHYCLAWPEPKASQECPSQGGDSQHDAVSSGRAGNEEFVGLREYAAGDSLRKVDWKGYARGLGLHTKQFEEPVGGRLWLHWDCLAGYNDELRLSILCYWVQQLSAQQEPFGLVLPGLEVAPDTGDVHRIQLLDALACYPEFH